MGLFHIAKTNKKNPQTITAKQQPSNQQKQSDVMIIAVIIFPIRGQFVIKLK